MKSSTSYFHRLRSPRSVFYRPFIGAIYSTPFLSLPESLKTQLLWVWSPTSQMSAPRFRPCPQCGVWMLEKTGDQRVGFASRMGLGYLKTPEVWKQTGIMMVDVWIYVNIWKKHKHHSDLYMRTLGSFEHLSGFLKCSSEEESVHISKSWLVWQVSTEFLGKTVTAT